MGLHQTERNVFNSSQDRITIDCQKQTQNLRGNYKGSTLLCSSDRSPTPPSTFTLLFSLPHDSSTFLPGSQKAISRSHTRTYINVTATQSTQQACLWETSGPRWHFPVRLQLNFRRQWGSLEGIVYLFKWTHKNGPSLFASWHTTVRAQNTACDHVNRPFGAPSCHLYSLSSDSLSRTTSSGTNHKGSLEGIDTILGTELHAANMSWMSDRLRKDMKQAIFALCPENPPD